MVPTPIALGLTLCDYVIIEETTKKASLIGSFTGLAASQFPVIAQPFCVFAILTDGHGEGMIDLVVSRLDTGNELLTYQRKLEFPNPLTEVRYLAYASSRFLRRQCINLRCSWTENGWLSDACGYTRGRKTHEHPYAR